MPSEHIVKSFDDELNALQNSISEMGKFAQVGLGAALTALKSRDPELAEQAADADEAVNQRERTIDKMAIQMIAMRQPMAADLRAIIGSLRAADDLERIGDQAKNIANRTVTLTKLSPVGAEGEIMAMGEIVQEMLHDILDAFATGNVEMAEAVRGRDVEVDRLHTSIFQLLLSLNSGDTRHASACTHLSFVARSLERIGDYATDIAEEIIFIVTGSSPLEDREKADDSFFVIDADT